MRSVVTRALAASLLLVTSACTDDDDDGGTLITDQSPGTGTDVGAGTDAGLEALGRCRSGKPAEYPETAELRFHRPVLPPGLCWQRAFDRPCHQT